MKNGPYILIKAPEEYPGMKYRNKYVYEHQYIWWKNTRILPPKGYQIHHKNGNKHDNRIKNLEMIFKGTHSKIHSKKKKKKILICSWCKEPFEREIRNFNNKLKIGQKNFYCCRSHQVIDQQNTLHRSSVVVAGNC